MSSFEIFPKCEQDLGGVALDFRNESLKSKHLSELDENDSKDLQRDAGHTCSRTIGDLLTKRSILDWFGIYKQIYFISIFVNGPCRCQTMQVLVSDEILQ